MPLVDEGLVDEGLVGRTRELAQIDALLDSVAGGNASIVVVTGEAGVGKTALLDAAARRADDRGFAVAIGRCSASESPPYWPWPRVLRRLGGSDEQLSRPDVAGRPALFAAAADRLEQASDERPVFVALDDLQWADESSLALGSFLAAATAGLRIALAFGVRDEAVDMASPLMEWLGALPADVVRLPLAGLDQHAISSLVRSLLAYDPPTAMIDELHARTGGNPLFVKECARLLAAQDGSTTIVVPERVRQVITRRVARLSAGSYTVVAAASVADDFDLDLLAGLTDMPVAQVADGLGETLEARLVVLDDDGYRFAHALIRETLLETQPAGRRADLHQRTATAIEARLERMPLDARAALAAQAAAHWARVPGGGRLRAARLASEAARSSAVQLAYDHSATLYQWAQDLGDDSLDTLTELGEAQVLAGRLDQGRETLATAALRAAIERSGEALARAVLAAGSGVGGYEVDVRDHQQVPRLRDALSLLGDDDSSLRSATLARTALVDTSLTIERRSALADDAAAMAGRVGDSAGEVAALAARCDILSGPDHVDDRLAATTRMVELAQRHGDPVTVLVARRHRLLALLEHGEIGRVDDEIAAYARTSDHLRLPLYSWIVPIWHGMRALMDGDRPSAADQCDAAEALGRSAGSANADVLAFSLRFAIDRSSGSTAALDPDVERILGEYAGYPAADSMRAVHLLLTGRDAQARRLLQRRMTAGIESVPRDSEWVEALWNLGEVAAAVAELDAVEAIYDALVPHADLWAVDGVGAACYGAISHQLGRLSIALDRRQQAQEWLDAAARAHESAGAEHLAATTEALRRSLTPRPPRPPKNTAAALGELTRDGPVWHVQWQGTATTVRHSKGILDIARLLERPGHEIHALDLMDPSGSALDTGGTGPMLDDTARRAYKQRLEELEDDLDEATSMADDGRVAQLEHERDVVVAEITRAYGLGNRPRTVGDPAERARKAVGMRITTAIKAIAVTDVELARHLDRSLVTGRYCSYQPETSTRWQVSR
ncbi:MAG: ATP-binding protein [Actinomycetota bacterium]